LLECSELANDITHIKLGGKLDIAGVDAVETWFYANCGGDRPRVLVDLADTGFVSSLGIRMLQQAIKSISARGGRLLLMNPASPVASTIEISGLGRFIVRGTRAEAVAKLLQPAK